MGHERPETTAIYLQVRGKRLMNCKCNIGKGQIRAGNYESFDSREESTINVDDDQKWSKRLG
jgi:hypothetical protein